MRRGRGGKSGQTMNFNKEVEKLMDQRKSLGDALEREEERDDVAERKDVGGVVGVVDDKDAVDVETLELLEEGTDSVAVSGDDGVEGEGSARSGEVLRELDHHVLEELGAERALDVRGTDGSNEFTIVVDDGKARDLFAVEGSEGRVGVELGVDGLEVAGGGKALVPLAGDDGEVLEGGCVDLVVEELDETGLGDHSNNLVAISSNDSNTVVVLLTSHELDEVVERGRSADLLPDVAVALVEGGTDGLGGDDVRGVEEVGVPVVLVTEGVEG
jgi:hypothetical protein